MKNSFWGKKMADYNSLDMIKWLIAVYAIVIAIYGGIWAVILMGSDICDWCGEKITIIKEKMAKR